MLYEVITPEQQRHTRRRRERERGQERHERSQQQDGGRDPDPNDRGDDERGERDGLRLRTQGGDLELSPCSYNFV